MAMTGSRNPITNIHDTLSGGAQLFSPAGNSYRLFRYLAIIGVATIYFAAAELGLSLAFIHANVSPVWPPTGVAIAAVLLLGFRVWPGILLGAFAANFLTPVTIPTAIGIAAGNTMEAVAVGMLLHRIGFHNSFDRAKDVTWFVVAVLLGTMLAATAGTISLCLGHAAVWENFGSLWLTWWLGDMVGGLVLAPLLLTWGTPGRHWLPTRRWIEVLVLLVLLSITGMVIFGGWFPTPVKTYPLAHLALPFLIWAAFRLGTARRDARAGLTNCRRDLGNQTRLRSVCPRHAKRVVVVGASFRRSIRRDVYVPGRGSGGAPSSGEDTQGKRTPAWREPGSDKNPG